MIQVQLKLKLRPSQERLLDRWLWRLTGVYNWAVRKIELDAANGIYHSRYDLGHKLAGHGRKIGVPQVCVEDAAGTAHDAWRRCFQRLARRPRMKGRRNRLNSISHHQGKAFRVTDGKVRIPVLGEVGFHKQNIQSGQIKWGRLLKRSSGWYLSLVIDAEPRVVAVLATGEIGIDPGFSSLLALSNGEKLTHPREMDATARRLAQAQRGKNRRLTARLLERVSNQRKDRNHKLSRRLVSQNALIAWSKDNHRQIARSFGKSVATAAHGQLRDMLTSKCRAGGREFIEVPSRNTTSICSDCGQKTGPRGLAGLSVRAWECRHCGAQHDRDINAARNILKIGRGMRLDRTGDRSPEIAALSKTAMSIRSPAFLPPHTQEQP